MILIFRIAHFGGLVKVELLHNHTPTLLKHEKLYQKLSSHNQPSSASFLIHGVDTNNKFAYPLMLFQQKLF